MEEQISVVISVHRKIFREGLYSILHGEKNIQIVGEAVNGLQTIDVVDELKPDVVLLDMTAAEMDGIQVILPIRKKSPKTKALILTGAMDEAKIFEALKLGAKGYISKDANASDLIKAIQAVQKGQLWIERKLMSIFFDHEAIADSKGQGVHGRTKEGLTPREQEVLSYLATGCTNKEIAQNLFISEKTVKTHLSTIFRKLKVSRRLEAILYAISKGLN
jgi:DNA-binding NarL/FixJ family response regulator